MTDLKESLQNHYEESELVALIDAIDNGKSTHALLLNTKKMSDEEFLRRYPNVRKHPFVEHAYLYDKEEYEFGKSMLYDGGVYQIEDSAAMMVNYFLKPQKDDIVLDICAAPGGKAIGASLAMEDEGIVIANDVSYPRSKAMSQNVERMGRGNMIVASNDFVFSHVHFPETFDKIIVDAPCSGTAMLRKFKEKKDPWVFKNSKTCARFQNEILEEAYPMLKPGGIISYSTCSFTYEENIGMMLGFKARHPEIEFIPLEEHPSFYRHKDLSEAVTLFPHRFEGEGQFICLFKKPGEKPANHFERVTNTRYKQFLEDFGLSERSNEMFRSKFYSMSVSFDTSHLNLLRYGVKLFEMRDIYIPDHHLAHFLDVSYSIPVSKDDAIAYVKGGTFPLNMPDGFYIISYDSRNLGFVKTVQGVAKNHYPKGLRRDWVD